jgi:hypothetical protein
VQVTNVQDDSNGSSGAAGVTGVVFYVGSAVVNGNFQNAKPAGNDEKANLLS